MPASIDDSFYCNSMAKKSDRKRKRKEDDDGTEVINAQLAAYGEKFMQMFEPTEIDTRTTSEPSSQSHEDTDPDRDSLDNDNSEEEEDDDAGDVWNDAADAAVEQIFNKSKTIPPNTGQLKQPIKKTKKPSLAPTISSPDIEKMERKRFMSHRAGVVSGAIPVGGSISKKKGRKSEASNGSSIFENTSRKLNKEEFQKLTREVHLYGATALDKKSKKQFDAAVLEGLGAKKAKSVKMPANMAIGMAKKRAKREAVALEEAIASGMVQKKGMGKKKRAEKQKGLDRGLMEDGGAFRNGVLKVGRIGGGSRGGDSIGRGGGNKSGGLKRGGGSGSRR